MSVHPRARASSRPTTLAQRLTAAIPAGSATPPYILTRALRPLRALRRHLTAIFAVLTAALLTLTAPARANSPAPAAPPREVELLDATLAGVVNEPAGSVAFRLRGQLRATRVGARLRLLSGRVALGEKTSGDGWHVDLVTPVAGPPAYELVCDRRGTVPLDFSFIAGIANGAHGAHAFAHPSTSASPNAAANHSAAGSSFTSSTTTTAGSEWRSVDFTVLTDAILPVTLTGLDDGVSFKPDAPVVPVPFASDLTVSAATASTPPTRTRPLAPSSTAPLTPAATASSPLSTWKGFLPANGAVAFAWKHAREAAEGALFFTSSELAEVRLGAGLLRQVSQVSLRVLQGRLGGVRCRLDGPGEIVGVEGANVVGWHVAPATADGARVLDVRFSRPVETESALVIRSQAELGNWPVRAEPLRLTPEGGVRHSGFVRVANTGAVRLEVAEAAGLMQLAPAQWPGGAIEAGARQVLVYRFPAASYGYRVLATQIQPEVGVSAIATYELGETARVIAAALELDVREAPLRDWTLRIPEDYSVVALTGADVADYAIESTAAGGTRAVRILFARAIEGRQLLQLRLEKTLPAAAGEWRLPALVFPGAKSVRGHLGAVATPGFRLAPARVEKLTEVPLSFFPRQTVGLQQAWRLRDADWAADLRIEALGQTVQADVFHVYSLREGAVNASVLLNFFVVGAPAGEWRLELPPGAGNIDVTGQNVRRDWRREGDQIVVTLHQPVLGAATLLVTFELPLSARGGVIQPGLARPLGVQSERGFVQVVSAQQVKHEIKKAEGALLKLEPAELPAEFRLLTSAPSLAVYHYTARPFALELGVEWFAPGETVEQVVDFAQLASQVSRDGQVVTEAKFFVKTRGRKPLRVLLPAGAKLWEARVDGELVNARIDGAQTLVPLPAHANPNEPVAVSLRVGQPAIGDGRTVTLVAPRAAAAATVISEWTVRGDAGRQLVPRGGNAEPLAPALTETGFEWLSGRGGFGMFSLLALVGLGALLLRANAASGGWKTPAGLLVCLVAVGGAVMLAGAALNGGRPNLAELNFAATMVPAGETVSLQLENLPAWRALIVGWGAVCAAVGAVALIAGALLRSRERERVEGGAPPRSHERERVEGGAAPPRSRERERVERPLARAFRDALRVLALLAIATGLLAQHEGAAAFFATLGAAVCFGLFVPGVFRWRRARREERDEPAPTTPPGANPAALAT
ncbi:MAG: hypothetical protein RLZZ15_3193 [Verrucomicrobiota bacterium]